MVLPDADALQLVAMHLAAGGVAVVPTETFYALAADPFSAVGVARVVALKGRPEGKGLPLIAGDATQVDRIAPGWRSLPDASALASRHWPGPLSLVLPSAAERSSLIAEVRADDRSIAIRVSAAEVARRVALCLGRPVIATSANRSGQPAQIDPLAAWQALGSDRDVWLVDGGPTPGGLASTIVDPRGPIPVIVRAGAISRAALSLP